MLRLLSATGLLLTLFCASAAADTILLDPATLHIGSGVDTSCATGGCPIFIGGALNGEVNNYGPAELDIYQNQGGAPALDDPVLLILGVPNNSVTLDSTNVTGATLYPNFPSLSTSTSVAVTAGTTADGINAPSGFAGLMGPGQEVYSLLGISGADASNSFTNWSAADLRMLGMSFNNFGIYVFSLDTTEFAATDAINVELSDIPEGTFAVAYGQDSKYLYDTPFTQAGLTDVPVPPVPEPSSLAAFATALLGLGLLLRRTQRHS